MLKKSGIDALDARHNPLVTMDIASFMKQEKPIEEPEQQGEIFETCVADLVQPIEVSYTLPIVEKDDFIILDEEEVPQGSVTLEGEHDMIVEVAELLSISLLWCTKIKSFMKWKK